MHSELRRRAVPERGIRQSRKANSAGDSAGGRDGPGAATSAPARVPAIGVAGRAPLKQGLPWGEVLSTLVIIAGSTYLLGAYFYYVHWSSLPNLLAGAHRVFLGGPPGIEISEAELALHDGRDPERPIYICIRGIVYDVSTRAVVYKPGRTYNGLTAKEAMRMFAEEVTKPEDLLFSRAPDENLAYGMSERMWRKLMEWEMMYQEKYPIVGHVRRTWPHQFQTPLYLTRIGQALGLKGSKKKLKPPIPDGTASLPPDAQVSVLTVPKPSGEAAASRQDQESSSGIGIEASV